MIPAPDRDVILTELRRLPPGARGPSAVELADTVAQVTRQPRKTASQMRKQLFQLQREGLVKCRIVKRGGAWRWVAEPDGGASHRHPRREAATDA